MHYRDDEQPPRRKRPADEDEDLVGPRRGAGSGPGGEEDEDGEDLVGPRRSRGGRAAAAADTADARDRGGRSRRSILDDDAGDGGPRPARRPRGRGKGDREGASLLSMVRDLPAYAKLLARLAVDPRVSKVDKGIVAAVLVYLVSPVDLVPDWVFPVVGQIEDVYLLALALSRLVNNAGMDVLLDHWDGDPATLGMALDALDGAAAILPAPLRAILGQRA